MSKFLRLALTIVETSSLPLLVLTILYILSGYQMLYYSQIHFMPYARIIHTDIFLRILFIIFTYLHSVSGLVIMCERRIKNKLIKIIVEYITITILSIIIALPLTLDILFS